MRDLLQDMLPAAIGLWLCCQPHCSGAAQPSRVSFEDDTLYVEGRPFFFIGCDGVPTTLEDYKAHRFNTVFTWGPDSVDQAAAAAELGLFIMPFVQAPAKRALAQCTELAGRLKGASNVLAFNVGDDLDSAHLPQVKACIAALRPEIAQRAVTAAQGKIEKVQALLSKIAEFEVSLPDADAALSAAATLIRQAGNADDASTCIRLAAAARRRLRALQQAVWTRLAANPEMNADGQMLDFYVIPQALEKARLLQVSERKENRLPNPSFEQDEAQMTDWSKPAPRAHGQPGFGNRVTHEPRNGRCCVRFVSSDLALWQGSRYDWVTAAIRSAPVAVAGGEYVVAEVWARVPAAFESTTRGAILNLIGFDETDKPVPGWTAMERETSVWETTDGWQRLRVLAQVDEKVVTVRLRIGIAGIGECFFDDARIVRWRQ